MKIGVIDLETTALSPRDGGIVEFGIVVIDTSTLNIIDKLCCTVYDENIILNDDAWIFKNSDLTIEEVKNSVNIENVRPIIQDFLVKYPITSYFVDFDFRFLEHYNFKIYEKSKCILRTVREKYKNMDHKMYNMYKYFFNEEYNEKHRALDDAVDEAKILLKLIELNNYDLNDIKTDEVIKLTKKCYLKNMILYKIEKTYKKYCSRVGYFVSNEECCIECNNKELIKDGI